MTDPQARRSSRRKIVGWTIGVISLIAVIAALVFVVQLSTAFSPKEEPTVTPSNSPSLEDQLRSKGPAEEAVTRYESAVQATADDLTKLVPGLTWRWNREADFLGCTGEFAETRGVRIGTRNLVSNGPYRTTPGPRRSNSFATTRPNWAPHKSTCTPTSRDTTTSPSTLTAAQSYHW